MKLHKIAVAGLVVVAVAVGTLALSTTPGSAAPPCPPPPFPCLDVYNPVECFKPSVGWKIYSNECYAHADCAKKCRPVGL